MMDVCVLGPMEICSSGRADRVCLAPKPRTVLALLCGHPGQMISVACLVREVWGEEPPASSLRNMHTYVLQVRKLLACLCGVSTRAVSQELLVTHPGGYSLSEAALGFDHRTFTELTGAGRGRLRDGELLAGIGDLLQALRIWRGPAFADVVTGPVLEAQRRQLHDARIGAMEALSEARISAGQFHEVISDLSSFVAENPLHEGLHFHYMRALALSGGRARALEVFSRLRLNLVSELGIEPGASMQQLQRCILNSTDPAMASGL
ncbi:BTAD domain-containing putative transcriptional regulator [Kitasatospora sp. NPDC059648]|uniref:AfsR/SARP family transcriptional regulator n=1 Tax=Kitasatospora sp. NPDC059648 TaxID=3346894 RepID=UPI0036922E2E